LTTDLVEISTSGGDASPPSCTELALADVLAGVVQIDHVGVGSHFFDDLGADSMVMARFCARVRTRSDLPSVSMKDIYRHPTIRALAATFPEPSPPAALPTDHQESALADVLAGILHVDDVPRDKHFFDDLGADSMVMAQFCARVRKRADLPSLSMKDVYQHPTIKDLAAAFVEPGPSLPAAPPAPASTIPSTQQVAPPASTASYLLCGTLQLTAMLANLTIYVAVVVRGFLWVLASPGLADMYVRAIVWGGLSFVGLSLLPIVAKWVLIGRWKPQQMPVWSLAYFRFWFVKGLIRANPLAAIMVGSPLQVLYLRALGARIGKGVTILSGIVPACPDLLTVGDGTVIRRGASLSCYRAHAGMIEIGPITLGRDVVIAEATVLDIDTSMGDRAQLGHSSSLHPGQSVPADERWHGTPARRTEIDFRWVPPTRCGTLRRVLYPLAEVLILVLVTLPVAIGVGVLLLTRMPPITTLLDAPYLVPTGSLFYLYALVASSVLSLGLLVVGLLAVVTVPRVFNLLLEPDKVYPLYGVHYLLNAWVTRLTNVGFFTYLFGDSSYIVYYLRALGYNLFKVEQTGSNFGAAVRHDNPYLSSVGTGTVVADGLSINNADFSSTSFRLSPTGIGARNFLGNYVTYPSQGKTGTNCLLATKVMVPVDGSVREGVGLLGSPSFEIPRSVLRDTDVAPKSPEELRRKLTRKNRHNRATIVLVLLARWVGAFVLLMLAMVVPDIYRAFGAEALVVPLVGLTLFALAYSTVLERAAAGFRPLRPQYCSIYDPYFWWHERYWKFALSPFDGLFAGTPFKTALLRLLGARVGRRVFDDGCLFMSERTLATIGDHCTLNGGSIIQNHSQEDGAFKSDYITLGSDCTVGVGAVVHYGVTMGDGSVLDADAFLMKGEQVPPRTFWAGNPAEEVPGRSSELTIGSRSVIESLPAEPWFWDVSAAALAKSARAKSEQTTPYPDWGPAGAEGRPDHTLNLKIRIPATGRPSADERWSWRVDGTDSRPARTSNVLTRSRTGPRSSTKEPWSWW
jgi:non-ribosomal peptide synthetase-like protein